MWEVLFLAIIFVENVVFCFTRLLFFLNVNTCDVQMAHYSDKLLIEISFVYNLFTYKLHDGFV